MGITEQTETWIAGYRVAWDSNDPAEITALFTEDAAYFADPSTPPWRGHDAIVAGWLEHRDEPGQTEFRHQTLALDGDLAVVRGWTRYLDPPVRDYANLWLVRLAPDGRCREFTEFWMRTPEG